MPAQYLKMKICSGAERYSNWACARKDVWCQGRYRHAWALGGLITDEVKILVEALIKFSLSSLSNYVNEYIYFFFEERWFSLILCSFFLGFSIVRVQLFFKGNIGAWCSVRFYFRIQYGIERWITRIIIQDGVAEVWCYACL